MNDRISSNEDALITKIRNFFKKKRRVKKGDLGVYHDILTFNTLGNSSRSIHYDIFVKVRATEVYDALVEVDVLDVKISESVSEDMSNFIKHDNIKYLKPTDVTWQVND